MLGTTLFKIRGLHLRSRSSLIAATIALQVMVIGLGWVVTSQIAGNKVSQSHYAQTIDRNGRVVRDVIRRLHDVLDSAPRDDAADLARLQSVVETTPLDEGVSLMLLDEQCNLIAHPALPRNANLRRVNFAEQTVELLPGSGRVSLAAIHPRATVTGRAELLAGPAIVTVSYDPRLLLKVVVMQPESEVLAAGAQRAAGMKLWGTLTTLAVLAMTALGSWLLVRRYDTLLMRSNRNLEREVERRTARAVSIRNGLIVGLAKLADCRDNDTGRHLERICRFSELLARELAGKVRGIDEGWIERLKLASSMHDIGKVGVRDEILHKPGPLTEQERREMQRHTLIGADTLAAIRGHVGDDELINMGLRIAQQHHERYDGRGYPFGLTGESIDLSARIVALADVYDALTSARVYKPAYSHERARQIIVDGRGTQFDPDVVDAFLRIEGVFDRARAELTALPAMTVELKAA